MKKNDIVIKLATKENVDEIDSGLMFRLLTQMQVE